VPILSADSRAKLIYGCVDQAEAFKLIEADLDTRTPNTFKELFNA
jgi:hypothetical protein